MRSVKRICQVDLDEVIKFQRYLRDLSNMPTLDFYRKYQEYMGLNDTELAAVVKRLKLKGEL
jgi:hypothetical protein